MAEFNRLLSAHKFFNTVERRAPVHSALYIDNNDLFLHLFGLDYMTAQVARQRPRGLEDAFDRWLNRGASMLVFIAILLVLDQSSLANSLGQFDPRVTALFNWLVVTSTGDKRESFTQMVCAAQHGRQCVQQKRSATVDLRDATGNEDEDAEMLAALEAKDWTSVVGDLVKFHSSNSASRLWALLNDDDLSLLTQVWRSTGLLNSKQGQGKLVDQQTLWQRRHTPNASVDAKVANPALVFFRVLCKSAKFSDMPFDAFAAEHFVPLGNENLNKFVATYVSSFESTKEEAIRQSTSVADAHVGLRQWLVQTRICAAVEAAPLVEQLCAEGLSSVDQLRDLSENDLRDLKFLVVGQRVRMFRALHATTPLVSTPTDTPSS